MINRRDLQDFLIRYPSISLKILSEFSRRLEKSELQLPAFQLRVETRIAQFLTECVENNKSMEFVLPMSKRPSFYLGTTPETISRKLLSLKTQVI